MVLRAGLRVRNENPAVCALAVRFEHYFATGNIVVSRREGIAASVRNGTLRTHIEGLVLAQETTRPDNTHHGQEGID